MAIKVREQDTFIQMDAADEQQILREMEGEIVNDLYYDVNGKKGLSYVGVNHMCFKTGGIVILPESVKVEYDKDTDEYVASVVALNKKYDLSAAGMSVQPKLMEVHDLDADKKWVKNSDGSWKTHLEYDRFARVKALSKAQRNAKRAVIPEALIVAYLDYFIKLKQGVRGQQPRDDGPLGMKKPRNVDTEYHFKSEKTPPPAKKTPEPKPSKPPEPKLTPSKNPLTKDVIEYNLRALDPTYPAVIEVIEYETEFMIAARPDMGLPDGDQYKIDSILQPLGAVWTDNRYWRISRGK